LCRRLALFVSKITPLAPALGAPQWCCFEIEDEDEDEDEEACDIGVTEA